MPQCLRVFEAWRNIFSTHATLTSYTPVIIHPAQPITNKHTCPGSPCQPATACQYSPAFTASYIQYSHKSTYQQVWLDGFDKLELSYTGIIVVCPVVLICLASVYFGFPLRSRSKPPSVLRFAKRSLSPIRLSPPYLLSP